MSKRVMAKEVMHRCNMQDRCLICNQVISEAEELYQVCPKLDRRKVTLTSGRYVPLTRRESEKLLK